MVLSLRFALQDLKCLVFSLISSHFKIQVRRSVAMGLKQCFPDGLVAHSGLCTNAETSALREVWTQEAMGRRVEWTKWIPVGVSGSGDAA